jgi:beta-lactamase regulating signal transducer with metallopeptidase domain
MHPQPYLQFTGAFLTFWVRMAVLCALCICVARLLRRPQHRFLLWAIFLAGSVSYWASILLRMAKFGLARGVTGAPLPTHAPAPIERVIVAAGPAVLIERGVAVCAFAYIAVLLFLLSRRLVKAHRLRVLLRFASPAAPALVESVNSLCGELGVKRCELMVLPAMISPGTVYWRNPRILLPESCGETSAPDLVDVLRHELVHIVRRDYLIAALSDAVCALLFFHPAVWIARKKMRLERELACDLAVVEARPEHRADYADNLARFMRLRMIVPPQPSPGIDFADSASVLGTRIRSILAEPHKTPWWRHLYAAGAASLCLMIFVRCAPALSFEFDLSSQSTATKSALVPESPLHTYAKQSVKPHQVPRHRKIAAVAADTSYSYPDNLTNLPLRQTPAADSDTSISVDPQPTSFASDEDSVPLWAESQSRTRRTTIGTVRDVALATAGGIALGEHSERGERGSHGHKLSH